MRALALLLLVGSLPGCWPGRCAGGLRAVLPVPGEGQEIVELPRGPARLSINVDTSLKIGDDVLAASQLGPRSVLLEGPAGLVPLTIAATVNPSAHSCASAGSVSATTTAPLTPGDYTFVVLLDQVRWPAIEESDITIWHGQRALLRRYRVTP